MLELNSQIFKAVITFNLQKLAVIQSNKFKFNNINNENVLNCDWEYLQGKHIYNKHILIQNFNFSHVISTNPPIFVNAKTVYLNGNNLHFYTLLTKKIFPANPSIYVKDNFYGFIKYEIYSDTLPFEILKNSYYNNLIKSYDIEKVRIENYV